MDVMLVMEILQSLVFIQKKSSYIRFSSDSGFATRGWSGKRVDVEGGYRVH